MTDGMIRILIVVSSKKGAMKMNSVVPVKVDAYRRDGAAMAFPTVETEATRDNVVFVMQAHSFIADPIIAFIRVRYAMAVSIAGMVAMSACAVSI